MMILRKLKCAVFGHQYRAHQTFTSYSRRVVCDHCGGDWAMNDDVRAILPWSKDFEEMYRVMGHDVRPIERKLK